MTTLTDTQVITASGGLVELGYLPITSGVTVNNGTAGTGVEVIAPLTVVCDGGPILVEFFSPEVRPHTAANYEINISLFEDGAEKIRSWGRSYNSTSSYDNKPVQLQARLTPSAGSHTYSVKSYVTNTSPSTNTGFVGAGTGTTGAAPAFLRVSKIVKATQWPAVTTGTIICTSSTRPASPFAGQTIYETDTSLLYVYNGSAWIEPGAQQKAMGGSYVWNTWTATNNTGTVTNAPSTSASSWNNSSYVTFSNSSGTLTATLVKPGYYELGGYLAVRAAGAFSSFRGYINIAGTATRYQNTGSGESNFTVAGESAADLDQSGSIVFTALATANQTVTFLPYIEATGSGTASQYKGIAHVNVKYLGS